MLSRVGLSVATGGAFFLGAGRFLDARAIKRSSSCSGSIGELASIIFGALEEVVEMWAMDKAAEMRMQGWDCDVGKAGGGGESVASSSLCAPSMLEQSGRGFERFFNLRW